jgi:UDP-2-acetamido-3-amino-2,3-dideoxy-glucuronate N-acetyltransferase
MPRASNYGGKWTISRTFVNRGASIGANATIVCGIILGEFCTVGAGSTVTRTVPPFALVVGVPARHIGWMSRAGCKLDLPVTPQSTSTQAIIAICPLSGEKYCVNANGTLSVL